MQFPHKIKETRLCHRLALGYMQEGRELVEGVAVRFANHTLEEPSARLLTPTEAGGAVLCNTQNSCNCKRHLVRQDTLSLQVHEFCELRRRE